MDTIFKIIYVLLNAIPSNTKTNGIIPVMTVVRIVDSVQLLMILHVQHAGHQSFS